MKIYQDFLDGNAFDVVVYPVSDLPPTVHAYTNFDAPSKTCYMRINTQEPDNHELPRPSVDFKQTLAHELYHCVQYIRGQEAPVGIQHDIATWWMEGTATFFAHEIFPAAQQGLMAQYKPKIPLY